MTECNIFQIFVVLLFFSYLFMFFENVNETLAYGHGLKRARALVCVFVRCACIRVSIMVN